VIGDALFVVACFLMFYKCLFLTFHFYVRLRESSVQLRKFQVSYTDVQVQLPLYKIRAFIFYIFPSNLREYLVRRKLACCHI
jgi:hypothetical protein